MVSSDILSDGQRRIQVGSDSDEETQPAAAAGQPSAVGVQPVASQPAAQAQEEHREDEGPDLGEPIPSGCDDESK